MPSSRGLLLSFFLVFHAVPVQHRFEFDIFTLHTPQRTRAREVTRLRSVVTSLFQTTDSS
jgi:hypothetical protein